MRSLKIVLSVITVFVLSVSVIYAKDIKKGDVAYVSDWDWIVVKNIYGIKNGNCDFGFGGSCGIKDGEILTAIAVQENTVFVRYSIPDKQYGTSCPSEVIFFITKESFSVMTKDVIVERNKKI